VQPLLETMTSLLGRLVFPEEKLRGIVTWKKRKPEAYVKAFNLCDGEYTVTQIADEIGVKQPTLSPILTEWKELDIIYEVTKSGGKFYKRLYRLGMPKPSEAFKEEETEARPSEPVEGKPAIPATGPQTDNRV